MHHFKIHAFRNSYIFSTLSIIKLWSSIYTVQYIKLLLNSFVVLGYFKINDAFISLLLIISIFIFVYYLSFIFYYLILLIWRGGVNVMDYSIDVTCDKDSKLFTKTNRHQNLIIRLLLGSLKLSTNRTYPVQYVSNRLSYQVAISINPNFHQLDLALSPLRLDYRQSLIAQNVFQNATVDNFFTLTIR